jgi:hypothetical protein
MGDSDRRLIDAGTMDSSATDESGQSLPEFLSRRARGSSDRRLAIDAAAGVAAAALVSIFRPPLWLPLLFAALCFATFGVWGIVDRELAQAPAGARALALRAGRGLAALLGGVAALGLTLTLFGMALGRWIS